MSYIYICCADILCARSTILLSHLCFLKSISPRKDSFSLETFFSAESMCLVKDTALWGALAAEALAAANTTWNLFILFQILFLYEIS